jgi:hypothetical protein
MGETVSYRLHNPCGISMTSTLEFEASSVPSNPSPFGTFDSGISAADSLKRKFEASPLQILTGSHPVKLSESVCHPCQSGNRGAHRGDVDGY